MTLTKTDLRSAVKAFKQTNAEADRRQNLYAGQRSSLYQLIIDDINAKEGGKVSRKRRNQKSLSQVPAFSAPIDFTQSNSTVPLLWECKMHPVESSFINAVGYNTEHRVLKILMNGTYLYAYQDVPESAFNAFLTVPSAGKYFNRFTKNYAGVRLA